MLKMWLIIISIVFCALNTVSGVIPSNDGKNQLGMPFNRINWVYQRVPRMEALVIKLPNRSLYPGDMNCLKNTISVSEFTSGFRIYFPTARKGATYSLIIYSDTTVFSVRFNIMAKDIFRGVQGPDQSIRNFLANLKSTIRVQVVIFEENPLKPIINVNLSSLTIGAGLQALNTISGIALGPSGKVCLTVVNDQFIMTPNPRAAFQVFQKTFLAIGRGW